MVILRLAKWKDLDQVILIEQQSFPYPFTIRTFEMLLKSSPELFLVATHGLKELPKISKKDPAIKELNVKVRDVIKIIRKSPTAGEAVFYRGVV